MDTGLLFNAVVFANVIIANMLLEKSGIYCVLKCLFTPKILFKDCLCIAILRQIFFSYKIET